MENTLVRDESEEVTTFGEHSPESPHRSFHPIDFSNSDLVAAMVRKKRAKGPSGGESSKTGNNPLPQQAAAVGGSGWGPQGGRSGYGGHGCGMPQQQYGAPPEYQGRGRGGPPQPQQQYGVPPMYQQGGQGYGASRTGRGGGGMGSGHDMILSYGGPPKPPVPEVTPQSALLEAKRPPPRPTKGSLGTRCLVKANHFVVRLEKKDIYQYNVRITPEVTSQGYDPLKSREINRAVMGQLMKCFQGNGLPAYDGGRTLYMARKLLFEMKKYPITLNGAGGQCSKFNVEINLVEGEEVCHGAAFLQALNIVLHGQPNTRYFRVGRTLFSPDLSRSPLGNGVESWRGFYPAVLHTQKELSLNIDMSTSIFIEALAVNDYVARLLGRSTATTFRLSQADFEKIEEALIGIKVETIHSQKIKRKYCITGLTSETPGELRFHNAQLGTTMSVADYFRERYQFNIRDTWWPCLRVQDPKKKIYLPMEVCTIVKGQLYSRRLNKKQLVAFGKVSCPSPVDREHHILEAVGNNAYDEDPLAREFGIKINKELVQVDARILPSPYLMYNDDTSEVKSVQPVNGSWNMDKKKLITGGTVRNWLCVNFSNDVSKNTAEGFCQRLAKKCCIYGMDFNNLPVLSPQSAQPDEFETVLRGKFEESEEMGKELDLLIAILPNNNGPLYGDLKRICETDLGLVSQCVLSKHVLQINEQYLGNVALKINVKVGGINTVLLDAHLKRIPLVSDKATIIFGADVTHPTCGNDGPSIAAVVASQDWPQVTKYAAVLSSQQRNKEMIDGLYTQITDSAGKLSPSGMIRELLISFYKANQSQKPERIIFYRDGVSEGEFDKVLSYELKAIQEAVRSFRDYTPAVTFVVVQKRHHTRLFVGDGSEHHNRRGNILPGTVVDSDICHPTGFDFYLCSHTGLKGTSRPTHYHVLWDENKFTSDGIQSLTYNLCYTYARCTRSVGIVPPVYYAHLAAYRARYYIEPDGPGMIDDNGAVRGLLPLKEKVKRVMFYC